MTSPLFRWGLGSAVLGGALLLGACSSNDDRSAFAPPGVDPTPTPVFSGSSATFVDFLLDLDPEGDPLEVNDGAVQFTDTAGNTEPVTINN